MIIHNSKIKKHNKRRGYGFINSLINKLPFELHLPGYNFCGPGTKLEKRLARGDRGVNSLDEACKKHDLAYTQHKDTTNRHQADRELVKQAQARIVAKDASFGEKAAALAVSGIMKTKTKFGMGVRRRPKKSVQKIRKRRSIKKNSTKNRIIPIPKTGGFLPLLLPILGALGALGGGAAGIAKAVNDIKASKEQLKETERHNRAMEPIHIGNGLYLKPYKSGLGLYSNKKN